MTHLPFEDVAAKSYRMHDARLLGYRPEEKYARPAPEAPKEPAPEPVITELVGTSLLYRRRS